MLVHPNPVVPTAAKAAVPRLAAFKKSLRELINDSF
jgi:hypothetical protein